MSISINTNDLIDTKKVLIDGMEWDFISPGAGTMLDLARLSRKITDEKATPEEESKMMETLFEYYSSVFKDSTKGNSEVKKWIHDTPIEVIGKVIQQIQEQTKE